MKKKIFLQPVEIWKIVTGQENDNIIIGSQGKYEVIHDGNHRKRWPKPKYQRWFTNGVLLRKSVISND